MAGLTVEEKREKSRILLHSQRNIYENEHFRLGLYEFEDIIRQIDSVDMLAPKPKNWFKYGTRIANRLATDYDTIFNPGIPKIKLEKDYDLFFVVAQFPRDLLNIKHIESWKDRCKTSICWMNEMWITDIDRYKYSHKILSQFDYVILQWIGSVEPVQEVIKKKCLYSPYGIDAIQFCPYPNPPRRVVDVYSIGRRSSETHKTLLKMFSNNQIFYIYDTIIGSEVNNPDEHRQLFANTAKRSRYFIVNPGRITRSDITQGQSEFGNRFFEGAASGTIMVGETPKNEEFAKVFNWPDAVIHLPFGSSDIAEVINDLDKHPERKEKIRKNNVVQSLRRHDWVYRWESVLKIAGLTPLPQLEERKKCLRELSNVVKKT